MTGVTDDAGSPARDTAIHRRVRALRDGADPTLVARMPSGWAVLGSPQVVRGYCLLLPDPVVPTLNDLAPDARLLFLADMARLGDAVLAVTDAARINYEMLGNLEPALHAHVIPRGLDEPPELRTRPIWFFDWEKAPAFDAERDRDMAFEIGRALT